MKKTIFFVIQLLIVATALFAKQSLDDAILDASKDIKEVYSQSQKSVLAIYEFEQPNNNKNIDMSDYIRNRLSKKLYGLGIKPVTRDTKDMAVREKELNLQHKSGKFNEKTIRNVAGLYGANLIAYGSVKERNNAYELTLKVQEVDSGYIYIFYYEFSYSNETEQLLGRAAVYKKVALGVGAEANMNSLEFIAPAVSASFDYNVFRKVSLGVKIFASFDVKEKNNNLVILEPLASLRVYLVSPSGEPGTGVFMEGLGGVSVLLVDSNTNIVANGGGGFGYRAAFGNFYIEPEIRVGYPYIFGVGLSAGFRF